MRKLVKVSSVIMMVMMMFLAVTGCSEKKAEKAVETAVETTTPEASPVAEAAPTEETTSEGGVAGALEGIELSVGTSGLFAPFSYYNETGTDLIGYDLDFLKALQELLGFTIKGDVQAMDYSALTTSVAEGKLDIAMAALCATDTRKEVMNFSDTYYDSGQIVGINKEKSPKEIIGIDALSAGAYKVAVEKGTASHLYAQANIPESSIEVHDTITTAYESLEQGKVDALIQDTPGIAYYIKIKGDTKLEMVGDEFNQGQAPYAVAVSFDISKKQPDLVATINAGIKELTENGTMGKIDTQWCK